MQVLSDADLEASAAYHLKYTVGEGYKGVLLNGFSLDLAKQNASGTWDLPVPGTYVINAKGAIAAAFIPLNYFRRTEPQSVLDAVKAL